MVFRAENASDLAQKIISLCENPEFMKSMGESGHKAVLDEYNWEVDGRKLSQVYKTMEGKIGEK